MAGGLGERTGGAACRRIFDELSVNLIGFLEAHPAVAHVELCDRPSVTGAQMHEWEAQQGGCTLPEDYKGLLALSDGAAVRWSLRLPGEAVEPFGAVHANGLAELQPLPAADAAALSESRPRVCAAAFDLDAACAAGRVALVYWAPPPGERREDPEAPEVWFQDLACRWHFIAGSFADYLRLAAVHLGVPQWHYAFTDAGLGPAASHWLALFCPDRLTAASEQGPAARARAGAARAARAGRPSRRRARSRGSSAAVAAGCASAATSASPPPGAVGAPGAGGAPGRRGARAERPPSAPRGGRRAVAAAGGGAPRAASRAPRADAAGGDA